MEIPQSLSLLRNDDLLQSVPSKKKSIKKAVHHFWYTATLQNSLLKLFSYLLL